MKKQYMPLVRCEHSQISAFRSWHCPMTKLWKRDNIYKSESDAMEVIKEALIQFDGKPKDTPTEKMSAKTAKELMITDWKIKVREVSEWEEIKRESVKYEEAFAKDDPKEDWFAV